MAALRNHVGEDSGLLEDKAGDDAGGEIFQTII